MTHTTTDFGYESIQTSEKPARVDAVFESVSSKYDLMNDLMSGGLHRGWKAFMLAVSQIRAGDRLLDIACGTGDLSLSLVKRVGRTGQVVALDRSRPMLQHARDRFLDAGWVTQVQTMQADAQQLPLGNDLFDHVTIGFGLRNVTEKLEALQEMGRVLKPGGQLLVLEFSKPRSRWLNRLYDAYSFHWIPKLGEWVAQDAASYQYLVESIRRFPDADTLKGHILEAGFERCEYHLLGGGIVALHRAWTA